MVVLVVLVVVVVAVMEGDRGGRLGGNLVLAVVEVILGRDGC